VAREPAGGSTLSLFTLSDGLGLLDLRNLDLQPYN
jgi:hypothetical protein